MIYFMVHWIWAEHFKASAPASASGQRHDVLGLSIRTSICTSHSCESDISRMPWRNLGSQWLHVTVFKLSKIKVTMTVIWQKYVEICTQKLHRLAESYTRGAVTLDVFFTLSPARFTTWLRYFQVTTLPLNMPIKNISKTYLEFQSNVLNQLKQW